MRLAVEIGFEPMLPASEAGDFTACRLPNNVVLLPGIEPRYDAYPATLYFYSHIAVL